MSLNPRQFCFMPEILYDYQRTEKYWDFYYNQDVLKIAELARGSVKATFKDTWGQVPYHEDVMTAPELPSQTSPTVAKLWATYQLTRVLPKFFPRTNLDTSPMVFEPYDFLHAFRMISYVNRRGTRRVLNTSPIRWCREVCGDPRGTTFSKLYIKSTAPGNHQPATALAHSPDRLDLGHNLLALKIDNVTLPGQITSGNDIDARQMLFQFAGKLSEHFQQNLRVSVGQSGNSENGGGDAQRPGIKALVDHQALDELASRCARIMNQRSRETPMETAHSKTADEETAHAEIAHPETTHTQIGSGDTRTDNTVVKRSKTAAKRRRVRKPATSDVLKAKIKAKTSKPLEARKALLDSAIKLELEDSELKVEPVKMEP
ncbi:hypothetical protein PENARI_c005G10214 [Penicillium arizonense]|uniref:Uncharacterized protein n=1 Tax=Penicillium arizonense TaxID=1835702 RepID=A0A1F5LPJ8_PENAI|nr:hypothetical protein PENARI_c005G10214 [Penicillium arizonense]OGE55142.1 hypothetical protein PENARI_c005G10214 [Penicillium arizonense]